MDFEYALLDLSRYCDEELRGGALLRIALLGLRHVFDADLAERLPGILATVREIVRSQTGIRALEALLRNLSGSSGRVSEDCLERAVLEAFPEEGETIMSTWGAKWIEEGERIGIEKGELLRARKAVAAALEVRFGEIPGPTLSRIEEVADLETLEWLLRVAVAAPSVEDFGRALPDSGA